MKKRERQQLQGFFDDVTRRLTVLETSSAGHIADGKPDGSPTVDRPSPDGGPTVARPIPVQIPTVVDPDADAHATIVRSMAARVASANSVAGLIDAMSASVVSDALDATRGMFGRRRRGTLAARSEHGHFANLNGARVPACRLCADTMIVDPTVDEITQHTQHRNGGSHHENQR